MRNILYFIQEAFRGFFQAKLMTFVSIMTIAAALFFMSIIFIGYTNIRSLLDKTRDQPDLAVYLKDSALKNSSDVKSLMSRIKPMQEVSRVEFVDKDSAWARFSRAYGKEMLEAVDDNPLPASIEIYLSEKYRSGKSAQTLQNEISAWSEVESVRYSREWIDLVEKFRMYFYSIAAILALIMLPALHFMISNTIKLTIYARKELVRNMHLVGATENFVNMPFLLEGMIQGFIGGILCVAVLYAVRISVTKLSISWGPGYLPFVISMLGVLFGWIGSRSAVRKFLA